MKTLIQLIFCLFVSVTIVRAQSLHTINYTVKDGLPSNEVYWMTQAKNGLMWIGCDAGLVSFDGVNFKNYPALNSRGKAVSGIQGYSEVKT